MNNKNSKLYENINIDELAKLAGIALSDEEKQRIAADIYDFVEFSECLSCYSESGSHRDCISIDALRDDVAIPSVCAQSITESSQRFTDGLFFVPRAIGKEDK